MIVKKIFWYISRLSSMYFPEIFYRIQQQIKKISELLFIRGDHPQVELIKPTKKIFHNFNENHKIFLKEKEYPIFIDKNDITKEIDWHKDISTNRRFPLKYSKNINVRDTQYGNAKYVWEINRLNFLLYYAVKYSISYEKKYLNKIINIISDWKEKNPYLKGVNWSSNIEINIRLIVFLFVWDILDVEKIIKREVEFKKFVFDLWIPLIYRHCEYSYKNPSKYSSANNHLIAEAAGLYLASSYWHFDKSWKWKNYAKKILEEEIAKQHSDNGINKEEAAEYIQFITDFFLISYIVGKRLGDPFSNEYSDILKKIIDYIFNFTDCKTNYPRYGDEDDGHVVNFEFEDLANYNNFSSILLSGSIIFNEKKYLNKVLKKDRKNFILWGSELEKINLQSPQKQKSVFYKEEGHFFFRGYDDNKEIYIHFNVAPLGYLSIAAHGHSDALSFSMNIDGEEVLTDSGTFTYHSDREWRDYFIGTLAHNTVRIDILNQAEQAGPLLWRNHYQTKVLESYSNNEKDFVKATHNGYLRVGCEHIRTFEFDKKNLKIKILDEILILDNKKHFIEIPFHLHPDLKVTQINENKFCVEKKKYGKIFLTMENDVKGEIIYGQENPLLGWYSKKFYHKQGTNVIFFSKEISKKNIFKTIINLKDSE